jgi:formylglycine-generating enzyme required for sulfatase activity
MEKQRVENRDGSEEAIIARTQPFAMDKYAVTIDNFRIFAKDTGYTTEAEKFQWSFVHEMLLSKEMIVRCAVFRQRFTLEDAIGSHACSLKALACM